MKTVVETFTSYNPKTNSNETHTRLRCETCGAVTTPKGSPSSQRVENALVAPCKHCSFTKQQCGTNWWSQLGLKKNPYIYGPMPWKRTGEFWRRVEARERGLLAWHWKDNQYKVVEL
jgi:hypothetical protein